MAEIKKVEPVDEIPEFKFDEEKTSTEALEIVRALSHDRQEWLQRKIDYLFNWNDYLTPTRKGPWAESSNLHLPLTMDKCLKMHAKLLQAFFFHRPWFHIQPQERLDKRTVELKERFMQWVLDRYINYHEGIFETVDKWLWETVTNGWAIIELRWDRIQRAAMILEKKVDQNGDIKEIEKKGFHTFFDGPVIEVLRAEDVYMMPDFDTIQPPRCPFFAKARWYTESELLLRGKENYFRQHIVDEILKPKEPGDAGEKNRISTVDVTAHEVKEEQDIQEGLNTVRSMANVPSFRILECYWTKDLDGDGIAEENVIWIEENSGKILRHTFLDKIIKTGRRPFFKTSLIRRPGRAYDIGEVELLYPIQTEIDAIHNQKIDFQTITTIPWFIYSPAAGIKQEEMRLEPGVGIPVDDVNSGIRFPNFPQNPSFHNQEEVSLRNWAGELTGLQGPVVGQSPNPVGAGRTATGFTSMLNEQNVQLDPFIKRIQKPWEELLKAIDVMLQDRLPDNVEFRVQGADGSPLSENGEPLFDKVKTRFELRGSVDYLLTATSANMNKEIEFQRSMLRNQTLNNPLLIQLGITNARTVYENAKDFLKAQGVLDPERFIEKPENSDTPMTLDEEIGKATQGEKPRIVLNDKHEEKIKGLKFFLNSEEFKTGLSLNPPTVSPHAQIRLNEAIAKHEDMVKAINAQQNQNNPTGIQMAPSLSARNAGAIDQSTQKPLVNPQEGVDEPTE